MSGPKKSQYEIRQEQRQRLREQRQKERKNQINSIYDELRNINDKINILEITYNKLPNSVMSKLNQWISEIETNTSYDLRDCWRGIKEINNYLNIQEEKLKQKKEQLDQEILEKTLFQNKVNSIIDFLDDIKNDYEEILTDGINQRIELFKKAMGLNPNNENTLKQINDFKLSLNQIYETHLEEKENKKYVADSFAKILNSSIVEEDNGTYFIRGSIDGVPISVSLDEKNSINLDTPTDGSCVRGLEALQKELNSLNINLKEIKVVNTGQVLNKNSSTNQNLNNRINA